MTLESAEGEIYDIYQWMAREAPGIVVQEQGRLRELWAFVDRELS